MIKILIAVNRLDVADVAIKFIAEANETMLKKLEFIIVRDHDEALRLLDEVSVVIIDTDYLGTDIAHKAIHDRRIAVIATSPLGDEHYMPDSNLLRFVSRPNFSLQAFEIAFKGILLDLELKKTHIPA